MAHTLASLRRMAVLAIGISLLASSVVAAQTTGAAPPAGATTQTSILTTAAFARQVLGENIWLTTTDGLRRKGRVKALTAAGMTVAGVTPAPVLLEDIARVEKVTHRVRNGAIAGFTLAFLVVGMPVVAVGYCEDHGCSGGGQVAGLASLYGLIGAAAGAAIGAAHNAHSRERDILFDKGHRTTTMSLAPILSPTRKGLAFSMTWR